MSRKDDRKAARQAKKQQKAQNYQKHQLWRREGMQGVHSTVQTVQGGKVEKKPLEKMKKRTAPVDDDDEEILSDFSLELNERKGEKEELKVGKSKEKKKPKADKEKKSSVEKKSKKSSVEEKSKKSSVEKKSKNDKSRTAPVDEEFDFMAMIDAAYSSGKLTKKGLELEDGEDGADFSFGSEEDGSEDEEYDSADEDIESEEFDSGDEESVSEEDEEEPIEAEPKDSEQSITMPTPSVTPSATAWKPKSLLKLKDSTDEPLSDASARLLKQIQSLINKLSTSNLCSIATELESLFPANRRKEVIQFISDTLLAQLTRPGGNLLDAFAVNFAALSVLLYRAVGVEFGAHLLEQLITSIDSFYASAKDCDGSLQSHPERSLINCITFASFLFDLGFCSGKLITDLIEESASRLTEIDVEIILKLFKCTGQKLRKEQPDFMKHITGKLRTGPSSTSNLRFKFMIEQIDEMQNSRRKLAEASTSADDLLAARKAIKSFSQARGQTPLEALQITLCDIRDISIKGKWWLIGSSWLGHSVDSKDSSLDGNLEDNLDGKATSQSTQSTTNLDALAKKHHMNTEVRKAIFSAIVSSEDASEAFASLLALKLAGKQEREIILVLLHCAAQERKFNPFYALVAVKLAAHARTFAMTLQFCLWDALKTLPEWPLRKCSNLARLYGSLLAQGCLPLSALRKAGWIRLTPVEQAFWQLLLKALFDVSAAEEAESGADTPALDSLVLGLQSILQKRTELPSASDESGNRKVTLLTANTNLSAFDDDFFNSAHQPATASSVSQQKWEECRALRDGLIYFLDAFCLKMAPEGLPFGEGVESFKRHCSRMRQLLSEIQ